MTTPDTSSASFFEAKYLATADPWQFGSSEYEQARYQSILAALSHARYRHAFEPGCSVGVLTEGLAELCDKVEAIDFSSTAIERARERCASLPNVELHCQSLTGRLPVQGFDLIVLSEIGYYFTPEDWRNITNDIIDQMQNGDTLLGTHWLGTSKDHRMSGDDVHAILERNPQLSLQHAERHTSFRLDRWVRV